MSVKNKEEMELQIEQITCFLKSVYEGMAHDIKIVWRYGNSDPSVANYRRSEGGKHEEITIGVGDAYYGSRSVSAMLYETAYHMRERLNDRLEDNRKTGTFLDLVDEPRS